MAASAADAEPALREIAAGIWREALNNIIHDLLVHQHRAHKLLLTTIDPTTKLPLCERCSLPRLLEPPLAKSVRGATSNPPADTAYCDKKPWCRKPGHDIYANPFPKADLTGRPPTKKEREEAAKNSKGKHDGTPASNEGGTAPPSPTAQDDYPADKGGKLEKGEKKASKIDEKLKKGEYVPWQTCPNCKRSLLIIRFAKHLEQCMGLSGRQASRNALAKMNGSGSGTGGTPAGSRGGTPVPEGGTSKADRENGVVDDDDDDIPIKAGAGAVRKKVLKKGLGAGLSSKLGKSHNNTAAKPITKSSSNHTSAGAGEGSKRDFSALQRDDDLSDDSDSNVHVKKRQKLDRVESVTSIASQSTAAAADMERMESQDGSSFVGGEDDSGGDGDD